MTRQRLTRTAASLVLAAVGAVALSVLPAVPAQAAPPEVLVSSDGTNFGPTLPAGIFDGFGELVPGQSFSTSLWVMNSSTDAAMMRVVVADLVVPSPAFATGVVIQSNDGLQLRTRSLGELSACSIIVPSRTMTAGSVVRIDVDVAMLASVSEQDAQAETASLGLRVALRDAAAGAFPALNGCPSTPTASSNPLAFTGAALVVPTVSWAAVLLVGGMLLLLAARRRRRDEEQEEAA